MLRANQREEAMYTFNTTRVKAGRSMPTPSQDAIENSLNLRQVGLEDAARYGGSVTRSALGLLDLVGDRKYTVVDTKVHFLMPGMCPAIPGWHTDGVPRGVDLDPSGNDAPVLDAIFDGTQTAPRYHLLVTGTLCPTRFLLPPASFTHGELVGDNPSDLYANMTRSVNNTGYPDKFFLDTEDSRMYQWDWHNIHTAQTATARGWRYLIRVTETDYIKPRTNPADFIRTQNNVYTPIEFGW
jgi:hypothetical protein